MPLNGNYWKTLLVESVTGHFGLKNQDSLSGQFSLRNQGAISVIIVQVVLILDKRTWSGKQALHAESVSGSLVSRETEKLFWPHTGFTTLPPPIKSARERGECM